MNTKGKLYRRAEGNLHALLNWALDSKHNAPDILTLLSSRDEHPEENQITVM
jgi:hypothetical protein